MQFSFIKKISILLTFTSILVVSSNVAAETEKVTLVDDIIQRSSIKIAVQSIPQQLAQLPQMLPISEEDKPEFLENFMGEISSNYNESDALNSIRAYFIENGDAAKLAEVQQWLTSSMGRRITQTELLNQQVDFTALQVFMQNYQPDGDDDKRHQEFVRLNDTLDLGNRLFALFETLVPKMFDVMTANSESIRALNEGNSEEFSQTFKQQLGAMKEGFDAVMSSQMIASMAYQFKDVSDAELSAYIHFMETEAGQHFLDLSLYSSIEYTTEWMLNTLPNVMKTIEAVEKP